MAWDEALLEESPQLGCPVLRLYSWTEPAASFGYFQKFADIERMTMLRPLVRRPTGGGLVPHDRDWTYSLVFPPVHPWYSLKAVESYRRLHEWIQTAFQMIGLGTNLSPGIPKESPGQCFIGAEQFDVVSQGRKIAGAAQRRTRHGLLIQGSIQPPARLKRKDWEDAFCVLAQERWSVDWRAFEAQASVQRKSEKLAKEKYATCAYTKRR